MKRRRALLQDARPADEHGGMNRPGRSPRRSRREAWLATALPLLGAACQAPPPRIPFTDDGTTWHASAVGGEWIVNKSFVEDTNYVGLELVLGPPAEGGWAWEFGFRYASGEGDSSQTVYNPVNPTNPLGKDDLDLNVDSEIETQFYEVDVGVRQTFRQGERLQPYFGVGGSLLQSRSEETFVQPAIMSPNIDPNPYPVDTPLRDHERSEIRPGIYMRFGLIWNALRDQVREETEFPIALDVRGLLSVDYSYLEFSLGFGFGR